MQNCQSQDQVNSCSGQETILITGGTGYIGSHTVVELIQSGYDLVIIDNMYNSNLKVLDRIKQITGKNEVNFENVNINDYESLDQLFIKYKFTSVIHFAALKAVGESVTKPLDYYHNNVGGTINLMRVMKKHNCNVLVFSSSACVYGENPICKEDDKVQPLNPYGQTKAMIEQIMQDYSISNSEFVGISLRYFNPIGAHPSGLIGESPNDIPNNLMPYIQKVAAGYLPHLNVFGTDYNTIDGTGVRDYIHVVDLAKGHISALKKKEKLKGYHVFNLGTGNGTSVLQLVSAFEKVSGVKIPLNKTNKRQGDSETLLAIPDKANIELEWKTQYTIEDMCKDTWNWVKNNPNGYDEISKQQKADL